MELPTVQKGQRKLVKIKEGQVFCLPSRIPHSPQRPEADNVAGRGWMAKRFTSPRLQ
ncbi:unnamed protein product [Effrenium voratum]|uniref:3-hydroxyanthranilate 3,4-dioxygenase n=1 Tax=Effrenium voratum TaxID=2562239 RepID=A0AA36IAN4_9DINO|nr:unnamed protein product [Effrenium voratum]